MKDRTSVTVSVQVAASPYSPVHGEQYFAKCPKTYAIPCEAMRTVGWKDLSGAQYGSMFVVGYGGGKANSNGARWVCRCACGRYVYRRTQSLKKIVSGGNLRNSCPVCRNTKRAKPGFVSVPGHFIVR